MEVAMAIKEKQKKLWGTILYLDCGGNHDYLLVIKLHGNTHTHTCKIGRMWIGQVDYYQYWFPGCNNIL